MLTVLPFAPQLFHISFGPFSVSGSTKGSSYSKTKLKSPWSERLWVLQYCKRTLSIDESGYMSVLTLWRWWCHQDTYKCAGTPWATHFPPGHLQSFDLGKPDLIEEMIINPELCGIFMQCERGFRLTRNDGVVGCGRWQVNDLGSQRWLVILFSTQCHWYRLSSGIFHSRGSGICVSFILVGRGIMMIQWRQI